jgi:hypothetical protein
MTDNNKPKFDLPWGTLLPLLAVLAGVIATYKPLVSERPSVANEKTAPVIAAQDVEARLWQDPIGVAQKQKGLVDKEGGSKLHEIEALAGLLGQDVKNFSNVSPVPVLLLAVMLDAGPYSEQAESRLRAREAVLEGLSESGFTPVDGEHIGFVSATWPPPQANAPWTPTPGALLLPWEECEAIDDPEKVCPRDTKRVVVVWLPASNFDVNPLRCFAALIDQLAPTGVRDKIDITLIGPANSTGLKSMVKEACWYPLSELTDEPSVTMQRALDGVRIISPRATAPDLTLLPPPDVFADCRNKSVDKVLEGSIAAGPRGGLHFIRTIAPDDTVLRELIAELARRRITPSFEANSDGRAISKPAHIVILSEWDTYYGRSMGATFTSLAAEQPDASTRIHSYYYLRGIDGRLPGDAAKEPQSESGQKNPISLESSPTEATEGLNHSDYLRRLGWKLKEANARWQREDHNDLGLRAIGLLGSDVYDKLMILRALRPQFRNVIFFTNNYDAHFERRDDWGDTRNLIIASPFGGAPPENFEHRPVAPFRDNNQTSMYVGTLVATGRMAEDEADSLSWQPRIFEISRHGAYDLSPPWYVDQRDLSKATQNWFRDWLFPTWSQEEQNLVKTHGSASLDWHLASRVIWSSRNFWLIIIGAIALLAIAAWISVTIASPRLKGGGTTPQRLRRVFASTTFCLVCGVPLIIFSVAMFGQYKSADFAQYALGSPAASNYLTKLNVLAHVAQEPLAFFSGISIWPSEMLRLIALMLAIHFMIKAGIDLRANERELGERFSLDPLPKTRFRWHHLGLGLEQWRMTRSDKSETEFSAQEAWHAYLCRNKFWPRFIRIGILFGLYLLFSIVILRLFPPPAPPARGDLAFRFDWWAIFFTAIGMMILSFYVVDAIQLNSNFIRMFARVVTKWGDTVLEKSGRSPPLTEEELSAYNEIFFVADRTDVVARLIWYPLIVLTLMIVARSSFFDNWSWSPGLLAIYGINACWALGSAILLRRAAEQLRDATLSNLQISRVRGHAIEAKRATFDELIAEIRGLKKGAFAPLSEQPFIRAVLFPGAGLGLLAVGQRLIDIF